MALAAYNLPVDDGLGFEAGALVQRLEAARAQIEERFVAGGAAVLAIMDILNKLIASMDQLTTSLDAETAQQTLTELEGTVVHLSQLPELEAARQQGFRGILATQRNLGPPIGQMQETLRYLRTFALTAKIAGAGVPDFAGFAEEILRRIQDGTSQVSDLSTKLGQLGTGLGPAIERGEVILESYRASVPTTMVHLSGGITKITDHRRQLMIHATSVKGVAGRIQTKLASILSAMQIGDMTRQRIEHCQSSFAILDEVLGSPVAQGLGAAEKVALTDAVRYLVAIQVDQTSQDFQRDTKRIVETVGSFHADLSEIATLRRLMTDDADSNDSNAMRDLETGIAAARDAVQQIEEVGREATALSQSTATTVENLVSGIGIVQVVRTDIHYMALNTNLRCSRIGEEGKAINVVTAELRNFAAQLDETAEKVLAALGELDAAAKGLATRGAGREGSSLDDRLERALTAIRDAAGKMESGVHDLSIQSEIAEREMNKSLSCLDFDAALGHVLRQCADELAVDTQVFLPPHGAVVELLSERIFKLYTMASERELHLQVFDCARQTADDATHAPVQDDDIFDALF